MDNLNINSILERDKIISDIKNFLDYFQKNSLHVFEGSN